MAAAFVSGAAALLLEERPNLRPLTTKAALQMTRTFMPDDGLVRVGTGSLNVLAAAEFVLDGDLNNTTISGQQTDASQIALAPGAHLVSAQSTLGNATHSPRARGSRHGVIRTNADQTRRKTSAARAASDALVWGASDALVWGASRRAGLGAHPTHWSGGHPTHWSGARPTHWSGAHPTHWSGAHPTHWSGAHPTHWSGAHPMHWSGARPTHWSGGHPTHWSGARPTHWSGARPTRWSGGHPTRSSGAPKLIDKLSCRNYLEKRRTG